MKNKERVDQLFNLRTGMKVDLPATCRFCSEYVHVLIYSFIQQIFIEDWLYVGHYASHGRHNGQKRNTTSAFTEPRD